MFAIVEVGTPGELVYEPVQVAVSAGRAYLEAHPDVYGVKRPRPFDVEAALRSLDMPVDWHRVTAVLANRTRMAEVVSLGAAQGRRTRRKEYDA